MADTLILGGTGFLGTSFKLLGNKVIRQGRQETLNDSENYINLDTWNSKELADFIIDNRISKVINCIGITDIDYCEKNVDEAYLINSKLPEMLSILCSKLDVQFTHVSTDAVFDGQMGSYNEFSTTNPISVYGQSKLDGELKVLSNNANSLIARVNFFGVSPKENSLFDFFFNALREPKYVSGFTDVMFSPLYVKDLVNALYKLTSQKISGLMHFASDLPMSKYTFGLAIAKNLGVSINFIEKKRFEESTLLKNRARNLSIDNRVFRNLFTPEFDLDRGILDCIKIRSSS